MDSLGVGLDRQPQNEPDPVRIELAELMMPTAGNTVTLKSCRALARHFRTSPASASPGFVWPVKETG